MHIPWAGVFVVVNLWYQTLDGLYIFSLFLCVSQKFVSIEFDNITDRVASMPAVLCSFDFSVICDNCTTLGTFSTKHDGLY